MAILTKDKVKEIIENRPDGSTPKSIVQGLIARGHELEGFGAKQAPTPVPQTRGQTMLSEFKTGLKTVGDASFGERAKLAAKGIGGAVSRTFEKTAEGFGDLGSLIGVATSGVDLNDEQKAQIFEDIEVQKKTHEYKDFISKKGSELGLAASFIAPSATLAAIPKAKGVARVGLGALAGLEAVTTDKIALEGELPTKGELATGAVLGGALPIAGAGLAKGKEFLGKTAPAQLLKSALKLTPTQKTKLTQLTVGGDDIQSLAQRGASPEDIAAAQKDGTVFDWLVEKGYKGSPKEIGIQLAVDSAKSRKAKKVVLDQVTGKFRDEIGISAPTQILDDLVEVFTGSRGNEAKLSKARGYLDRLKNEGLSVAELDEVKTFFDQNSSIFKAAGLGDAKAGAKSQGLATLRRELKEFIEKQAEDIGDIRQINKDISAARSASEAILERADAAGGNAIFKLTDVILGGGAGGAEFARTQDPIKALKVGFGVAIGKRMLSNPNFQTALAKGLQKTFSDGEAGVVLKALQGDTTDVTTPIKKKFQNMLRAIVGESDEFADDIKFTTKDTAFKQDVTVDFSKAGSTKSALVKEAKKFKSADEFVKRNPYNKSKVKQIVHHGTLSNFEDFGDNYRDIGFHFGTKEQAAKRISGGKNKTIKEVYLNLKNPIEVDFDYGNWSGAGTALRFKELETIPMWARIEMEDILLINTAKGNLSARRRQGNAMRELLKELGHDGIIYPNKFEGKGSSYIAFDADQIKTKDQLKDIWKQANK